MTDIRGDSWDSPRPRPLGGQETPGGVVTLGLPRKALCRGLVLILSCTLLAQELGACSPQPPSECQGDVGPPSPGRLGLPLCLSGLSPSSTSKRPTSAMGKSQGAETGDGTERPPVQPAVGPSHITQACRHWVFLLLSSCVSSVGSEACGAGEGTLISPDGPHMSLSRDAPCLERPQPAVTEEELPGDPGLPCFHGGHAGTLPVLPTQCQASCQTTVSTGLNLISPI